MLILFPALFTNCGYTRCLSHVGTEGRAPGSGSLTTEYSLDIEVPPEETFALFVATQGAKYEMVELLLRNGADVNAQARNGHLPFT